MNKLSGVAVIVACAGFAQAQVFEAFDNSGGVGTIDAFTSATDIAGAYNYAGSRYSGVSPARSSLIANAVNVVIVDATDGFGFITVFSNAAGSGGSFNGTVTYTSIETIRAEDDGSDNGGWNVGDSGTLFDLGFSWSGAFTDGWASTFDSTEGSTATISATSIDDANVIVWHSADGSIIRSTDVLGGGFGVRVIPAPGSAAMLGLGGLLVARRRR